MNWFVIPVRQDAGHPPDSASAQQAENTGFHQLVRSVSEQEDLEKSGTEAGQWAFAFRN